MKKMHASIAQLPIPVAMAIAGLLVGCGDDPSSNDCGGHGELHGDHCDCDDGYERSEDMLSCLPRVDSEPDAREADASGADAGVGEDAGDVDVSGATSLELGVTEVRAATATLSDGSQAWMITAISGSTILNVELYDSLRLPAAGGTLELDASDTDYANCTACVVVQTGCESHGDHYDCEGTYMPVAYGTLRIDSLGLNEGEPLAGQFSDLVLQEVRITSSFTTEVVDGGDLLAIQTWAFDTVLESLEGEGAVCGGHGEPHGNHCDCDTGYRLDPEDPFNCIPE
jgi:hypothetical protein